MLSPNGLSFVTNILLFLEVFTALRQKAGRSTKSRHKYTWAKKFKNRSQIVKELTKKGNKNVHVVRVKTSEKLKMLWYLIKTDVLARKTA